MKLTSFQQKVKDYLERTNYTHKEIASRLGKARSTISVTAKRMRDKGLLKPRKKGVVNESTPVGIPFTSSLFKVFRYHNLHFRIFPYYFFPRYKDSVGKTVEGGGWLLKCHTRSLEVQLLSGEGFSSVDKWACSRLASRSLLKFLELQGDRLGFAWRKDGRVSMECVNGHLALEDSESGEVISRDKFFQLRGEDGCVWFQVDKSKGFSEPEFVHPKDHFEDSEAVAPFIRSLRSHTRRSGEVFTVDKFLELQASNSRNLVLIQDVLAKVVKKLEEV